MSTKQDSLIKTDCPVFMSRKCELFGAANLKKSIFVYKKYFFIIALTQQNCDIIKLNVNKIVYMTLNDIWWGDYDDTGIYNE